jgi:hypothetical protein
VEPRQSPEDRLGGRPGCLRLLLLFVPLCVLAPQPDLRFAPRPGTVLEKRFEFELQSRMTGLEIDGHELGDGWLPTVRLAVSVQIADAYARVANGRPEDFTRTYGDLGGKWFFGDTPRDILGFYALTGVDVRFVLDEETGEFARTVTAGKLGDCEPARLVEDLDLRAFLPAEPVAVGDRWVASGPALVDALCGFAELGLCGAPEGAGDERLVRDVLLPPLRGLTAQKFWVDCERLDDDDAAPAAQARIALDVFREFEVDLTDLANDFLRDEGWSRGLSVDSLSARWRLSCKGELSWDTNAGHFAALRLPLHFETEFRLELRADARKLRLRGTFEGEALWSCSAERRLQH